MRHLMKFGMRKARVSEFRIDKVRTSNAAGLFITLLALTGMSASFADEKIAPLQTEEGYVALYDGESLQGWRRIGGNSTYEASGESIVGRAGPGKNTFLRTEKLYADFNLKLQMRWDEEGNSGILFRSAQRRGNGRAFGYQYELDPSERAWSGGIYDEARRGWIFNLENNQAAREAIRLDDWNDVEVDARGARIRTWINGVPAADILDGLDREGFIALQVHKGGKGVMRWRNIQIREYAPIEASTEGLEKQSDWISSDISNLEFDGNTLSGKFSRAPGQILSRQEFSDAQLEMTVPACKKPAIIRVRYNADGENGAAFAEVKIFPRQAVARLVTAEGVVHSKKVRLRRSAEHRFVGVVMADALTFTVDEKDILRTLNSGLAARGQVQVIPAQCRSQFSLTDISWQNLGN